MKSYRGRSRITGIVLALAMAMTATTVLAMGNGYTPGTEGTMAPSIPPPGFHYKMYNLYLDSDKLIGKNGHDAAIPGPDAKVDFKARIFAQAHRFIYITDQKILGADYGMSLIVPVVFKDIGIKVPDLGIDSDDAGIGLGDIFIEPLVLAWHTQRWDVAFGLGVQVATGKWGDSGEPANGDPGNGYHNGLITFGATYYLDEARSWTVSGLSRTVLYFGEQDDTDYRPGDELIIDWGVAKQFPVSKKLLVRMGLVGYTYWQWSDDRNRYDGVGEDDDWGYKYAVGAEINLFWLPQLVQFNLRWLEDVKVRDEFDGTTIVGSLTISF